MNTLAQIQDVLNDKLGFSEQARLTEPKRRNAINEALFIVYGLLIDSPILRRSGLITLSTDGVVSPTTAFGLPPSNFNDGSIIYLGDSNIWDQSNEVYEVDGQSYGQYTNEDYIVFTKDYNEDNELVFNFQGAVAGSFYIEYEMGAPTLVESGDNDNLPRGTIWITAKIAAGILIDNLLSDGTKMQILLYGPNGNPTRYTPDSVMGQLQVIIKKRRIRRRRVNSQRTILI